MHIEFDPDAEKPIHNHYAMKEIEAISKLSHINIVGYKGCWVEAAEPDSNQVANIIKKLKNQKGKEVPSMCDGIDESDDDDSQYALSKDLNNDLERGLFCEKLQL